MGCPRPTLTGATLIDIATSGEAVRVSPEEAPRSWDEDGFVVLPAFLSAQLALRVDDLGVSSRRPNSSTTLPSWPSWGM